MAAPWVQSNETPQQWADGQAALSHVSEGAATALYVVAGAALVALFATSVPKYGVPLLILVAAIMLVRANHKAG